MMRNRFPGICYRCHKPVAKGEGHFEKERGTRPTQWRVQHAACCIKAREAAQQEHESEGERQAMKDAFGRWS